MKKIVSITFLFILLFGGVLSLGVTPARTTLDFKSGLKQTINFDVTNSGDKDIRVSLSAQGELAEYIFLSINSATISSNERTKTFSYDINMPEELSPGLHTAEIYILEIPEGSEVSEAYVRATLAVVTQVYVYVPYPGKYANADLRIINANSNGEVIFIFPVVSAGDFDLTSVKANVDIYNKMGEKISSFETDSISVPSGEKKELVHQFDASKMPVGEYRVSASLAYDEGTVNLEDTFSVGSQTLELQKINTNRFNLGDIVKLEMLIENKWSEPISGAHIEAKILNERGDIISRFESAAYDISALKKQTFVAYWDTAGVKEGIYEAEIVLVYGEKTSTNSLEFEVKQNELNIVGLGHVVAKNGEEGRWNSLIIILVVIIILLILINLLWFIIFKKKLKGK